MIKLFVEPQTPPLSWKEFLKKAPERSVAIDGYVADSTKFSHARSVANFNHHENVDRLSTRATCAQILMAIRLRFFDFYRNGDGEIEMSVFANDCDEDVCASYFLLKNGHIAEHAMNPNLNRLVTMEDALDTSSGAYPFPKDLPVLKELAWVFEPYRRARFSGLLNRRSGDDFIGVITDVEHRIMAHITGRGQQAKMDTSYKIIGGGKGWKMVEEIGLYARTGMISDGIAAFATAKERPDGKWNYVVGKLSPFVANFDVADIFKRLNEVEGSEKDRWGGSDIIGGSPRVGGSKLSPSEVEKIVEEAVSARK